MIYETAATFDLLTARCDTDILKNKIVVSKDKRGKKGSREHDIHLRLATEPIMLLLDAPAHTVTITTQEEDTVTQRTQYKNIQS